MPEKLPYAYDRCAELGIKPSVPINAASPAEIEKLIERVRNLEAQLLALTGAKEVAKPAITT